MKIRVGNKVYRYLSEIPKDIPWRCKNGHILGFVGFVMNDRQNDKIEVLIVIKPSVQDMDQLQQKDIELSAILSGTGKVYCSICKQTRTWQISKDALGHLVERSRKNIKKERKH